MREKLFAVLAAVLIISFALSGCGAFYGSQAQYDAGDWYMLANSREAAKIKSDQLAFKKLAAAPTKVGIKDGVPQGYEGLVANLSSYNRYNFKLTGPETKSYMLGPGERARDHLIPGKYFCQVFQGGTRVGSSAFSVGPQKSLFMNETYHWYVYADR